MATAKQFVAMAASQIGYREGYDRIEREYTNDNKFGIWYGMNFVAWCAIFVSWVAFKVGALGTIVPKFASCYVGLTWFRNKGLTGHWPPQAGDIFIMRTYNPKAWNADADGWATQHTGIVEKYLGDGRVQTIEGNTNLSGSSQGNGVYRLIRQDSPDGKKFIYCRPKWDPEPVVVAPKPPVVTAPAPKPIAGAVYSGSKTIDLSTLAYAAKNPAFRSNAAFRWNGLVWAWLAKNNPAYCRANQAAWLKESSYVFGRQGQLATQEMYRLLAAKQPTTFSRVSLPTWPGAQAVKAVGGTPVA